MKRAFYTTVSALALLSAAPAFAGNNTSTGTQSGTNAVATVSQAGSNSTSAVTQAGDQNNANINQDGTQTGGSSTVSQTGNSNNALVTQADDASGANPKSTLRSGRAQFAVDALLHFAGKRRRRQRCHLQFNNAIHLPG